MDQNDVREALSSLKSAAKRYPFKEMENVKDHPSSSIFLKQADAVTAWKSYTNLLDKALEAVATERPEDALYSVRMAYYNLRVMARADRGGLADTDWKVGLKLIIRHISQIADEALGLVREVTKT